MIDREKVKKGLCACTTFGEYGTQDCKKCPYYNGYAAGECWVSMNRDVLAMMKEQEAILLENQHKPYGISTNANSPWISRCPRCGKKVEGKQTRFCKYCGQAVKWE